MASSSKISGKIKEQKENVNERMKSTRKDIETLKADLQKLIQTASQTTKPSKLESALDNNYVKLEDRKTQRDKTPIIKPLQVQYIPKKPSPVSPGKPPSAKSNTPPVLDKKRHYNVQEAREYIRKQREKRAEQIKLQTNLADNNIDIKKQKLKELQVTCKELVVKNVQYSRQRSKSRDTTPHVRPDRSRSRPKGNEASSRPDRSRSRTKNVPSALEPQHNIMPEKLGESLGGQERGRNRIRDNVAGAQQSSKDADQKLLTSAISTKSSKSMPSHLIQKKTGKSTDKSEQKNIDYLRVPLIEPKSTIDLDKTVYPENIICAQPIKETTKKSTNDSQQTKIDYLHVALVDNAFDKTVSPSKSRNKEKKQKIKMMDAYVKDSKETQTSQENHYALLQPGDAVPYPYNFINTVKWKLQQVVTTTPKASKAAFEKDEFTPQTQQSKNESLKDLREKLIKSASSMRLMSSQKPPNLDFDVVENLGLVNHVSDKSGVVTSKRLFDNYDSESDTSKNIPEISSESISEKNLNLQLSLGKVKELKLIKNKSNGHPQEPTYSSDFMQESSIKATALSKQSNISKDLALSINTNKSSLNKSPAVFTPFFLKEQSNESRENFQSLFTDSQISKTPTFYPTNISSGASLSETGLKPPPLSLNFTNRDISEDAVKNVTIRSLMSEVSLNAHDNDQSQRSFTSKPSTSFRDRAENQISIMGLELPSNSNNNRILEPQELIASKTLSAETTYETNQDESIQEPAISPKSTLSKQRLDVGKNYLKNITIRPVTSSLNNNVNEIHLKFEAEVRLLNDFNESFKQFVAVEKAFEDLKDKDRVKSRIFQNVDTQTSVIAKTSNITDRSSKNSISTISFSRGSEFSEEEIIDPLQNSILNNRSSLNSLQNSSFEWNLHEVNDSATTMLSVAEEDRSMVSMSNVENCNNSKGCAGILSLNIFDQLIKDEDARIEHLRTIIKIREQALLDRTKGELVWLEIQRKQLIETGKVERASLIKKKQRGIILKHEQERNEIKRLKQMQKEESEKRKNSLKQQRNIIKSRLSTENMLSGIKVIKTKERRSSGPLRVVQSCSESIHSEVSFSIKSSIIDEVSSVTSRSVRLSEVEPELEANAINDTKNSKLPVSNAKRTLFIRETALQKRRKTAEELLQWHRKLLDEEKKIVELEKAATTVIGGSTKSRKFTGKQLNQLWTKMTGLKEDKYVDDKVYVMSQVALEQLCKSARQYSHKIRKSKSSDLINEISVISDSEGSNRSAKKITSETNYSSVFESDSAAEEKTRISSIAELIDNFSRIEDEISIISRKSVQDIEELNTKSDSSLVKTDISLNSGTSNSTENLEASVKIIKDLKISTSLETTSAKLVEEVSQNKISDEIAESQITLAETPTESLSTSIHSNFSKKISEVLDDVMTPNVVESSQEAKESETVNKESSSTNEIQTGSDEIVNDENSEEAEKLETVNEESSFNNDIETSSREKLDDYCNAVDDQEGSIIILSSDSEKSTPEKTSPYTPEFFVEKTEDLSVEVATERTSEVSNIFDEQLEIPKSTLIPIDQNEQNQSIANLSLEEALESASHIEESLSKINEKLSSNSNTQSESNTIADEDSSIVSEASVQISSSTEGEKTPQKKIDVKKRVSEILADASPRSDRSPRVQDLYVTTYDVVPIAESGDGLDDGRPISSVLGYEAEELRRKQLAIEQEIKQLELQQQEQELQQKEQPSFRYMREIPNKPPPPYTPPSPQAPAPPTIVPSDVREISEIACYSSKVLFKACETKALDKVKFSENGFKLLSKKEVPKIRAEFLFNVCKDITRNYYKQFEDTEHKPSWLILPKQPTKTKPKEAFVLEKILNRKLKETFGFVKAQVAESAIIKWGRKKRDHVDEVLVVESLEEESQWTNFDLDQLLVKDRLADEILNMLLQEECNVCVKIFEKKFRVE